VLRKAEEGVLLRDRPERPSSAVSDCLIRGGVGGVVSAALPDVADVIEAAPCRMKYKFICPANGAKALLMSGAIFALQRRLLRGGRNRSASGVSSGVALVA
jgi:hypothetical protein